MRFAISRVIPLYRQFVRAGEMADVFHSLAVCDDEVVCVIRRHKILDLPKWFKSPDFYKSRIMLRKFDIASGAFVSDAVEIMPVGEDPRCIAVGTQPYVLMPNSPTEKLNYVLFDIKARKRLNLEFAEGAGLKYGKNWQPFVFGNQLYAVHSFSPFRIIRIDTQTGECQAVFEQNVGMDTIAPHDRFTHFRGGGTALAIGQKLIGFAHFTIDGGRHMLFRWTYCPAKRQLTVCYDVDVSFLAAEGFNIVDPTSFFVFNRKYYLGVSCSNRDWFYGQTHASFLLELDVCGPSPAADPLTGLLQGKLANRAATENPAFPKTIHFFRAAEMYLVNGTMDRKMEVHWRKGKDDAGFVIHGPYIDLPPGKYRSRVQYASPADIWHEIGYVDVCGNPAAGQTILAEKRLPGTRNELEFVELDFEVVAPEQGHMLETRVVSTGSADIRLTDVAITRL
jgi:hypothetical protein